MSERSYNLKRPPHLIAGQVLRDIEVIANVKFGPQSSEPVHRLAEQYQILLSDQDQKILELESELTQLKREIRNLSDVGLLFDGCDELNEETHEENSKHMEGALDRIYELVTTPRADA